MSTYHDDQFDGLKGKKINGITWSDNGITFILKDENVYFKAVGDCCSSSYIESLDNPEIFKDAIFESVESVEARMERKDDFDIHKWTFYKFKTSKGMCTLSFRNESNGCYDGHLERQE